MKFCEVPRPDSAKLLAVVAAFSCASLCMKVAFALKPSPSKGDGNQVKVCCNASSSPCAYADWELVGALNWKLTVPSGYRAMFCELTMCCGRLVYALETKSLMFLRNAPIDA